MAKQELKKISQEELDEILEQHFLWLTSNEQEGICADLSFCDLEGLTFPDRVKLHKANLKRAIFKNARLIEANFVEADLEEANFENANLEYALFEGANLAGANFFRANLRLTYLFRANLIDANFKEAKLIETRLQGANLARTDFFMANLEKVNFVGAYIEGANFIKAYLKDTVFESRPLKYEEEQAQLNLEILQLTNQLQKAQAENNQSQEQQEKIAELEKQLELAKKEKEKLENKIELILKASIDEAHDALKNALDNTDKQIGYNQNFVRELQSKAIYLIYLDIVFLVIMPFIVLFETPYHRFLNNDKVGIWGILFFTFPILLILLIALSLLRHQKQLIAEIRHYSMLKHKIELYGGILKAAKYTASSVIQSQNSEAAKYIQETFNEIKTELLKSPNFDLNAQPHIFPEEGGNLVEMLKSITELLKISTEANKAIAESAKKATTSEK